LQQLNAGIILNLHANRNWHNWRKRFSSIHSQRAKHIKAQSQFKWPA